jgi:hypothetical protein
MKYRQVPTAHFDHVAHVALVVRRAVFSGQQIARNGEVAGSDECIADNAGILAADKNFTPRPR